jgi:hypothetical protein
VVTLKACKAVKSMVEVNNFGPEKDYGTVVDGQNI